MERNLNALLVYICSLVILKGAQQHMHNCGHNVAILSYFMLIIAQQCQRSMTGSPACTTEPKTSIAQTVDQKTGTLQRYHLKLLWYIISKEFYIYNLLIQMTRYIEVHRVALSYIQRTTG